MPGCSTGLKLVELNDYSRKIYFPQNVITHPVQWNEHSGKSHSTAFDGLSQCHQQSANKDSGDWEIFSKFNCIPSIMLSNFHSVQTLWNRNTIYLL